MFPTATALSVDDAAKAQLESLVRSGTTPQRVAQKCRVILLAQEGMSNHSIAQTTRPVAPDGDRRPRQVWRWRSTGADREADAQPAAPDADRRVGEKDSGYHAQNQATGRDAVDRANARQTAARVAHDGASGLAAFRYSAPPGREIQIVQRSAV